MSSSDVDRLSVSQHDVPLETVTNSFDYEDATVTLQIGDKTYRVGRSHLVQRSLVFRDTLQLPQPPAEIEDDPTPRVLRAQITSLPGTTPTETTLARPTSPQGVIRLHNDPGEFEHYLRAIHADLLDFHGFAEQPASAAKCSKLLAIANVAHMYESTRLADRCLGDAFKMLESAHSFAMDAMLVNRLLRTTSRWNDRPEIASRARAIVIAAMGNRSIDNFGVILAAESVNDTNLMGWAYYHILKDGDSATQEESWCQDARLRPIDRQRLCVGAYSLASLWYRIIRIGAIPHFRQFQNDTSAPWSVNEKLNRLPGHINIASEREADGPTTTPQAQLERLKSHLFDYFDVSRVGL